MGGRGLDLAGAGGRERTAGGRARGGKGGFGLSLGGRGSDERPGLGVSGAVGAGGAGA